MKKSFLIGVLSISLLFLAGFFIFLSKTTNGSSLVTDAIPISTIDKVPGTSVNSSINNPKSTQNSNSPESNFANKESSSPKLPVLTPANVTKYCLGSKNPSRSECMIAFFKDYALKNSFVKSNATLSKLAAESNGFDGLCHSIGHAFGAWSIEQYGKAVITQVTDVCGFSVGHGMLQEAGKKFTRAEFSKSFADFCKYSTNVSDCVHGYGHALWQAKYKTLEIGEVCTKVSTTMLKLYPETNVSLLSLCTEGWMMEDLINDPQFWGEEQSIASSVRLCDGLSGYAYYGCSDIAVSNWAISPKLYHNNSSAAKKRLYQFRDYCLTLKEIPQGICFGHLGYTAVSVLNGPVLGDKVAPILTELCSGGPSQYCVGAYVNGVLGLLDNNKLFLTKLCQKLPKKWYVDCIRSTKPDG